MRDFSSIDNPLVDTIVTLGRVIDCDPYTCTCNVIQIGNDNVLFGIPYVVPFASISGTPYHGIKPHYDYKDNTDFYKAKKKLKGEAKAEYVTEGQLYEIPKDAIVVILNFPAPVLNGQPLKLIWGCVPFPAIEKHMGYPIINAEAKDKLFGSDATFRLGNKNSKKGNRVKVKAQDYSDEVGINEKDKENLSEEKKQVLPAMTRDTYWQVLQKAKTDHKSKEQKERERFDSARLGSKYYLIGDESDIGEVEPFISETLVKIDKQGKILIASELLETLVQCECSDSSEYEPGDIDNGTFISLGKSANKNYLELSAKDWQFFKFNRGVSRINSGWRVHSHPHEEPSRQPAGRQTNLENFLDENEIRSVSGHMYFDTNMFSISSKRVQFVVEGVQFSCGPENIFFSDGRSLAEIVGG